MSQDLVTRLKERARIRRSIPTRKSVVAGEPDRIADLLEEAAVEIEKHNRYISEGCPTTNRLTVGALVLRCEYLEGQLNERI